MSSNSENEPTPTEQGELTIPAESASPKKRVSTSFLGRLARKIILILIIAVGGIFFLSMTASKPDNLGVSNGRLAECPDSPNCVSTQAEDPEHRMPVIPYPIKPEQMVARIKHVIASEFPSGKLVSEAKVDNGSKDYLHYEFKSKIFRFVDDVEFLVDDKSSVVHFRSASRVGHSDLGVNRKRMEQISERLNQ